MTLSNKSSSRLLCINRSIRHGVSIVFAIVTMIMISTSFAMSAPPNTETCTFLEQFHGHTCAGSLMGLRLGLTAKEVLKGSGKLKAKCFLLACPVDGIQVGTGTTVGNKALEVEDRNELYLTLTDVKSGRQVEVRLTEKAIEMGKSFRDLSRKSRSQRPGSPEQLRFQKEVDAVLDWFRTAPDSDVVIIRVSK